jgi:hypothetical protein
MTQYKILLDIGDWSGDGHRECDEVVILSNLLANELPPAFQKGSEVLGFNVQKLLDEYEESTIPAEYVRTLSKHGILKDWGFDTEEKLTEDWDLACEISQYVSLWLRIAKLGNPNFEYEVQETRSLPNVYIGGYGLYPS